MKKLLKISISLILFSNILMAQKLDKFDDLYYMGISERLSKWMPVGINQKAVIKVVINEKGQFDYEIKQKAESEEFNESLIKFLEEQKNIRYPVNRNRITKIQVDFKSKENIK